MIKAFFYLRVSTDDKGQEAENQVAGCFEYASKLGAVSSMDEVIVVKEEISAWRNDVRPVFKDLIERARKERVQYIFTFDYDRIYRDRVKLFSTIKNYSKFGVKILSYRQQWLQEILAVPEPFNEIFYDFLLQIVGWIAEEESNKRSDRVKAAYNRRKLGREQFGKKVIWGRKSKEEPDVIALVQSLRAENPKISIRDLALRISEVRGGGDRSVSRSVVHRILSRKESVFSPGEIPGKTGVSESVLSGTEIEKLGTTIQGVQREHDGV